MNDKPRYFRLLEIGEVYEKDRDYYCSSLGVIEKLNHSGKAPSSNHIFRPVQVDEWQSYAERKPTKEDFEPTGKIDGFSKSSGTLYTWMFDELRGGQELDFWRRITPPQPAKPKSVELRSAKEGILPSAKITPNRDGTANLDCGSQISAESIDEFIKAREEVTRKDL